jgi:hypothetical protein
MTLEKVRSICILSILTPLTGFSCQVLADSNEAFLKEISSPMIITKRKVVPPRPHKYLTDENKKNIRAARQLLQDFLGSFSSKDDNPVNYLSIELQKKYIDRADLFAKEFEARTILQVEIFDFFVKSNGEILFYVVLTDTKEGIDRSYQTAFGLEKTKATWNISRFSDQIKFREAEERASNVRLY